MQDGTPGKDRSTLYTPIAIVLAGALVGGGLMFGLRGPSSSSLTAAADQPNQPSVNIKNVKVDGEPYIGKANAPVVLAFWSDFQCPYCKAFETGGVPQIPTAAAMPDIIKNYVDTGKVKIIFKDYAFLGNDSIAAAEYGRAVWHLYPDQYFAWRTAMYNAQDQEGDQGFGNASTVDELIASKFPKMDDAAIKADVTKNKVAYDTAIQGDQQEGQSMGITGTPGFVTGTQTISGAQSFAAFQASFDAQLK